MKLASIITFLACISPSAAAVRGVKGTKTVTRVLKGDDGGDGGDTTLPDLGDLADLGCFSASSSVQVRNRGEIAMKDLQVGDQVLTSQGYQPVYAFGHKATESYGQFVHLVTDQGELEMTAEHMVFVQNKTNPVRADSIKVGDALRGEYTPAEVIQIGSVIRQGLFAPLTKGGTIVVDGVVASTYISLQKNAPEWIQVQEISLGMSQQSFVHMATSPFRMMCQMMECNSYNEQGMPSFVANGLALVQWEETLPPLVRGVLLAAFAVLAGAFMAVVESSWGLAALVAATYAVMNYRSVRASSKSKMV